MAMPLSKDVDSKCAESAFPEWAINFIIPLWASMAMVRWSKVWHGAKMEGSGQQCPDR